MSLTDLLQDFGALVRDNNDVGNEVGFSVGMLEVGRVMLQNYTHRISKILLFLLVSMKLYECVVNNNIS